MSQTAKVARLAQVFSKLAYAAMFALAGKVVGDVPPDMAADIAAYADVIGPLAAGLVALGFDLAVHKWLNGGVLSTASDGGAVPPAMVDRAARAVKTAKAARRVAKKGG